MPNRTSIVGSELFIVDNSDEVSLRTKRAFEGGLRTVTARLDGSIELEKEKNDFLTQNVELNVEITGSPVAVLQEWYDQHWEVAEEVTPEILKTVE